jgi:hypothetical protein
MAVTATRLVGDLAQTSVGATGAETQVIGLIDWSIDWKRKTLDSTTTDDEADETNLGSTRSWTAKAKYLYIDGDASQQDNVLAVIQTPAGAQVWNFFPTVETGRDAWKGSAWIDSITIASGVGKVVGLDVSLKGTGRLTKVAQIAPQSNQAED